MKRIVISNKKNGILVMEVICYDKRLFETLLKKFQKDKRMNVSVINYV